jgi:hypothetical protein
LSISIGKSFTDLVPYLSKKNKTKKGPGLNRAVREVR